MRTVPAVWVAIALAGDDTALAHARKTQVQVGQRLEVDLDALEALNPQAAERVEACANRISSGHGDTTWAVPVAAFVQKASGTDKVDLTAVFEALSENPATGPLTSVLLKPDVSVDQVAALTQAMGGSAVFEPGMITVDVEVDFENLPDELGGVAWPGEVSRHIRITARHAPWRDRQVRRLAKVEVFALIPA